jgi:hypothetical protein
VGVVAAVDVVAVLDDDVVAVKAPAAGPLDHPLEARPAVVLVGRCVGVALADDVVADDEVGGVLPADARRPVTTSLPFQRFASRMTNWASWNQPFLGLRRCTPRPCSAGLPFAVTPRRRPGADASLLAAC